MLCWGNLASVRLPTSWKGRLLTVSLGPEDMLRAMLGRDHPITLVLIGSLDIGPSPRPWRTYMNRRAPQYKH